MKSMVLAITLISSLASFAGTVKPGDELLRYSCRDSKNLEFSLVITATAKAKNVEGVKIPARLSIKRIFPLGVEVMAVPKVYEGKYNYEDVMAFFKSNDKKVSLILFADELDQTQLEIVSGRKTFSELYDCNPKE